MALYKDLVDDLGAATSRQSQHERLGFRRVECLDAA